MSKRTPSIRRTKQVLTGRESYLLLASHLPDAELLAAIGQLEEILTDCGCDPRRPLRGQAVPKSHHYVAACLNALRAELRTRDYYQIRTN